MEKMYQEAEGLLQFIKESPSTFHVIANIREKLLSAGFEELDEKNMWEIKYGQDYFVTRNDSSIIAFRMPDEKAKGFHVIASHSDSPTFKLKENSEMAVEDKYVRINTEKYGGMIMNTFSP